MSNRGVSAVLIVLLMSATVALVAGCGQSSPTAAATTQSYGKGLGGVEVVELSGSLNGARRGKSAATVRLAQPSSLRFDVTYGAAPGWGANKARFHYWLYPVSAGPVALPAVPLRVTYKVHTKGQTVLRLQTVQQLSAGRYTFLYQGSGWYGMSIYR